MPNAELIEELEQARMARDAAELTMLAADEAGTLTDEIESAYLEADDNVHQLTNEVAYRLNWEPRAKAWR